MTIPPLPRAGEPVAIVVPRIAAPPPGCFPLGRARAACLGAIPLDAHSPFALDVGGQKFTVKLGARRDPHSTVTFREKTIPPPKVAPTVAARADTPIDGRAQIRAATATSAVERLWREPFIPPLKGGGHRFALRRTYFRHKDGKLAKTWKGRHLGVDIGERRGAPIRASNAGRVVLTGYFRGTGRCVYLDHGLGLFTMYFHMDRVLVGMGDLIKRGKVIGRVGTTGSSTAPHLHWEARIGKTSIDPSRLISLTRQLARIR